MDVFNIDNGVVKAKWVKWIVNFFLEGFQGRMESPSHAWAIGTIALEVVGGYGWVYYEHGVDPVICRCAKIE